jgi:hypothetical protein
VARGAAREADAEGEERGVLFPSLALSLLPLRASPRPRESDVNTLAERSGETLAALRRPALNGERGRAAAAALALAGRWHTD